MHEILEHSDAIRVGEIYHVTSPRLDHLYIIKKYENIKVIDDKFNGVSSRENENEERHDDEGGNVNLTEENEEFDDNDHLMQLDTNKMYFMA